MENKAPVSGTQCGQEKERNAYHARLEGQLHARNTLPMLAVLLLCCAAAAEFLLFGGPYGIAAPACALLLCPLGLWFLGKRKMVFRRRALFWLIPGFLLGASGLFNTNVLTSWITFLVLAVVIGVMLVCASGASGYAFYESGFAATAVQLFVPMAVKGISMPLRALRVQAVKVRARKSPILWAGVGLMCALPFFLLLSALFSSADTVFRQAMADLLDLFHPGLAGHVAADFFLGLLAALYLGSVLMVLRSAVSMRPAVRTARGRFHPVAVSAFLSLLILLELAFGGIQFRCLFSGMRLPDGSSFASYARSGFFQIAIASILTVGIIVGVTVFTQKKESGLPLAVKGLLTLFACCVGVLYASAFYRMGLYMRVYGLSVKRVMVCWLMALLGVLLCGVLYRVWRPQANLAAFVLLTVLSMTLALGALRVDALTAGVNVERYLRQPKAVELDVEYLGTLSADAVPYLERLIGTPMENRAREAMTEIQFRAQRGGWRNWSVSKQRMRRTLQGYRLTYDPYAKRTWANWPETRVAGRFDDEGRLAVLERGDGVFLLVDRDREVLLAEGVVRWIFQEDVLYAQVREPGREAYYYLTVECAGDNYFRIDPGAPELSEQEQWVIGLFSQKEVPGQGME